MVPINEFLHWSLITIVNPGILFQNENYSQVDEKSLKNLKTAFDIEQHARRSKMSEVEKEEVLMCDGEKEGMFFMGMDRLRSHDLPGKAELLRAWLRRVYSKFIMGKNTKIWNADLTSECSRVFSQSTMPIKFPSVPRQTNTFDCAMFLLRYALGVISLRNSHFKIQNIFSVGEERSLSFIIKQSDGFNFEESDLVKRAVTFCVDKFHSSTQVF